MVGAAGGAGAALRARRRREAALGYLLLLPALALFVVFSFYPFLRNFKLMLYETPPVPGLPAHYVGLHQIIPTLTLDPVHPEPGDHRDLRGPGRARQPPRSASLLAVAAHRRLKGMAVYRVIFSSTVVSSVAVASVVFGTLLNPVVGLLPWLGINPNPPALESTTWALPSVRRHHHLAVPRPVLHHHVGRAAVGPRRAARGGTHRRGERVVRGSGE